MIHRIRTSKFSKIVASYLAIQLILTTVHPTNLFALTGGPSQPEFNSFTPIGTSDMVNLASGDFNYNIPIMDVGGYPLNLSYNSGITMDQEATWVGLGWNLNIGQINRQVRGLPDDFNGDEMLYENNLNDNRTVGANVSFHPGFFGSDIPIKIGPLGLGADYNNYTGWSYSATSGVSAKLSENVSVGMSVTTSSTQGVSISPNLSLSNAKFGNGKFSLNSSIGTTLNSRQGLMSLNVSSSISRNTYSSIYKMIMGDRDVSTKIGGFSGSKSFLETSYTPTKRNKLINRSFAANASIGLELFGGEAQLELYAYGTEQSLAEKTNTEKAYGYNFTHNATTNDVLDFNRENDRVITKNINALPVTNYTYDLYTINGQGIGGMYQPYRSQVGYVFDDAVEDLSRDGKLGVELGSGSLLHMGIELRYSPSQSKTGLWYDSNPARSNFIQSNNNSEDYETVFYKSIGELNVDNDANLLYEQLGGEEPIKLALTGGNNNKNTVPDVYYKGTSEILSPTSSFVSDNPSTPRSINRTQRLKRNQAIQSLSKKEVMAYYFDSENNYSLENKPHINNLSKDHHTFQTRILQPDGSTYVFGQPAYNTKKVEATFNVSNNENPPDAPDASNELIAYNAGSDNGIANTQGRDNYFNRITTPAYVHTFLISEVLSSDYEDLTGDGPSDDDLGAYTKFHYTDPMPYNWRVPFEENMATSNKGFNTLTQDNMGNYIYGEKELFYVEKIETKTHVAIFDLNERNDGYGVKNENGGLEPTSEMYQIDKIYLYSKPEYQELMGTLSAGQNFDDLDENLRSRSAIKIAHFEYDYSLCKGVRNNDEFENSLDTNELPETVDNFEGDAGGKLTLKRLYFTYRGSNMGKYTPYEFNYEGLNPRYHIKGYNLWGNYKHPKTSIDDFDPSVGLEAQIPNMGLASNDEPTTAEFPYVEQFNKELENDFASAWTMTSIDLPSGGKIKLNYESDDYAYVQEDKAMQMFKVRGAGFGNNISAEIGAGDAQSLYNANQGKRYIYVELPNETEVIDEIEFKEKYLSGIESDPIFFKFFMKMNKLLDQSYDYVSGYCSIDLTRAISIEDLGDSEEGPKIHVAIPVRLLDIKNSHYDDDNGENPFSKAGWYFGRQYLNRVVYGQAEMSEGFDILAIAETVKNQLGAAFKVFEGPNRELKELQCARNFSTTKSWIRLNNPNSAKLGGDIRVSKIEMFDEWDSMTGNNGNELYKMSYGQEYIYNNTDGSSNGVATFEPLGSKENPVIEPFYDDPNNGNRLLAPKDRNFLEKPFGISFFPSPKVTYSKVEVKNLQRGSYDNGITVLEVGNNGTGKVISHYYTTKKFPTIAKHTVLGDPNEYNFPPEGADILAEMFGLNFYTQENMSMSQGFTVITNDMNGKLRSQEVYPESDDNNESPISKVEYFYSEDSNGNLDNNLLVIDEKGNVEKKVIGVDYNVVNDFRRSSTSMQTYGADVNIAIVLYGIYPVISVSPVPQFALRETELRTATTTKVIHKTGILVEKRASDVGAEVTTKNLAWDASTGQVILTETDNEYRDRYYNFSYPAYWNYKGMAAATNNLGITLPLEVAQDNIYTYSNASEFLVDGDEILIRDDDNTEFKGWVTQVNQNSFSIIGYDGSFIQNAEQIKVMRSGYRNLQSANMASITLMKNPINQGGDDNQLNEDTFEAEIWDDQRIVNASAVKYQDIWPSQCECNLPKLSYSDEGDLIFVHQGSGAYNPYLYNIKGDWRANESYAYLTGRYNGDDEYSPRSSGFFKDFSAFYKLDDTNNWYIDETKWTSASQVTQFSPFGAELENKDALHRYSSAQYGYNYKYPVAVASNSQYREIGFDGFEDYILGECGDDHFSFKNADISDGSNEGGSSARVISQDIIDKITSDESHTGNNSIMVSNNKVRLNKRIVDCDDTISLNAVDDTFYTCNISFPALDVLGNDIYNSNDIISVVSQPSCGTITILDNGTPNNISDDVFQINLNGSSLNNCVFTYEICNSPEECSSASAVIIVCTE